VNLTIRTCRNIGGGLGDECTYQGKVGGDVARYNVHGNTYVQLGRTGLYFPYHGLDGTSYLLHVGGFHVKHSDPVCPRCTRKAAPEHVTSNRAKCWHCEHQWSL
jgi:hypothetical protein